MMPGILASLPGMLAGTVKSVGFKHLTFGAAPFRCESECTVCCRRGVELWTLDVGGFRRAGQGRRCAAAGWAGTRLMQDRVLGGVLIRQLNTAHLNLHVCTPPPGSYR
jgi:hypothetical protein